MTDKRFTTDGLWIEDNVCQHSFHVTSENNVYALTDLLNILAEENMMLKGTVAHYKLLLMSLEKEAKRLSQIRGDKNDCETIYY